jgi:hypothetical protein
MNIRGVAAAVVVAALTTPLAAAGLMAGRPEDAGLSAERLDRVREAVKRSLDAGSPSGAVRLTCLRGRSACGKT